MSEFKYLDFGSIPSPNKNMIYSEWKFSNSEEENEQYIKWEEDAIGRINAKIAIEKVEDPKAIREMIFNYVLGRGMRGVRGKEAKDEADDYFRSFHTALNDIRSVEVAEGIVSNQAEKKSLFV